MKQMLSVIRILKRFLPGGAEPDHSSAQRAMLSNHYTGKSRNAQPHKKMLLTGQKFVSLCVAFCGKML